MGMAICFKCGSAKSGALVACRRCNATPRANSEYAVSLALSDHLSSNNQLAQYSHELRNGQNLSVPREALVKALDALKDPQLLAMLRAQCSPSSPSPSTNLANQKSVDPTLVSLMAQKINQYPILLQDNTLLPQLDVQFEVVFDAMAKTHSLQQIVDECFRRAFPPDGIPKSRQIAPSVTSQRSTTASIPSKSTPRLITTALHQSAFAVLGVTTRDDRRRIVELAEEKSLELDHDVCQKARSDLTNPRTRLGVEIAWLPGVSPRKAGQLVENLLNEPMAIREESGLPTLAHLILLSVFF